MLLGLALCFSLLPLAGTAAWADEGRLDGVVLEQGVEADVGTAAGNEATGPEGRPGADAAGPAADDEGDVPEDGSGQGSEGLPEDGAEEGEDSPPAIELAAATYSIEYRAHVAMAGWQGWVAGGKAAGTTGKSRSIEALEIRLKGT
ncbi:MAG: hypothetical protein FWG23_03970, partial [Eggerthellaceae bacterium]|nr:hypothetical protein [Eggerthellaceae bacterium]